MLDRRAASGRRAILKPSMMTSPEVQGTMRHRARRRVDLPDPVRPMIPTCSCREESPTNKREHSTRSYAAAAALGSCVHGRSDSGKLATRGTLTNSAHYGARLWPERGEGTRVGRWRENQIPRNGSTAGCVKVRRKRAHNADCARMPSCFAHIALGRTSLTNECSHPPSARRG
jgi:hypothetical protein